MLFFPAATPSAADLEVTRIKACTDFGYIDAQLEAGRVHGTVAFGHLDGTPDEVVVAGVWSGPLADLGLEQLDWSADAEAGRFAAAFPTWRVRGRTVKSKGFEAVVDEDGVLIGRTRSEEVALALDAQGHVYGGYTDESSRATLWSLSLPIEPIGGADLTALAATRESALDSVVGHQLQMTGYHSTCLWGGVHRFRLPGWSDPVLLSADEHLVWRSERSALVESRDGNRTWYLSVRGPVAAAQSLAATLGATFPDHHVAVSWHDDALLAVVSDRQSEPANQVEPTAPGPGWDPLLESGRIALEMPDTQTERGDPLSAGREMVAYLNDLRLAAGLPPVSWDRTLGLSALTHCAYVDYTWRRGEYHGHDQHPDVPVFVGETPSARAGALEVLVRQGGESPYEAVDGWLETPFHRYPIMHPAATRAGACATPGGARVMEVAVDWDAPMPEMTIYPPDGATGVPRTFDGYETPDPLPMSEYPAKTLPVGFTLAVWMRRPFHGTPTRTWISSSGRDVPHYLVVSKLNASWPALYLIPKAPLAASTVYEWGVDLGDGRTAQGRFTTVPPKDQGAVVPARLQSWLDWVNLARRASGLVELAYDPSLDRAAAVYSTRRNVQDIPRELLGRVYQAWCTSPTTLTRKMTRAPAPQEPDPFERIGIFDTGSEICFVRSDDPNTPRAVVQAGTHDRAGEPR